jgi:CHASE3 domain sensor protein
MEAKRSQKTHEQPAAKRIQTRAPDHGLDLMRKLRQENERLKKLVAEQQREIRWLRYVAKLK